MLNAKDNQTVLRGGLGGDVRRHESGRFFPPAMQMAWDAEILTRTSVGKRHSRRERRTITTTPWLNSYLTDWPEVGPVFRLVRERTVQGVTTVKVVYGITSLTPAKADAARLLALTRSHWRIENGLHHIRDEMFREDRYRIRRGHALPVLASLQNVAAYLLR